MKHEHESVRSACNAEQPRLLVSGTGEQVTSHLNAAPSPVPEREPRDSRGQGAASLIRRSRESDLDKPRYRLGQPTRDGYRYGPGRFVTSAKVPEANLPRIVAGQSLTTAGFELLDAQDSFVSWHECILDAVDALKAHKGAGKVVRCRDRALMKHRQPHRGRP